MNYQVKILTNWKEVEDIKEDWDRLFQQNSFNTLFQMFEWSDAWWKAFGHCYQLRTLVIKNDEEIVAIVPLTISKKDEVEFLGIPEIEYHNILSSDMQEATKKLIIDEIFKISQGRKINLWETPLVSAWTPYLEYYLNQRGASYIKEQLFTFQCRLYKKINKKDVRHKKNKLIKLGKIEYFQNSLDINTKMGFLNNYFTWLQLRFSKSPSRYRRRQLTEEYKAFCSNLIRFFDGRDNLPEVYMEHLTLAGNLIAIDQNIHYQNVLYGVMRSYDPKYFPFSPGSILLQNSLNSWLEQGTCVIDFLRGDEDYKMRYVNTTTELLRFTVYPGKVSKAIFQMKKIIESALKPVIFKAYGLLNKLNQLLMAGLVKRIIFVSIWYSGIAFIYQILTKNRCRILCYHSISDNPSRNSILSVTSHQFSKQVKEVKRLKSQGLTVDITFDDGYRDNFLNAYPILKKEEVKSVIFPAINYIAKEIPGWHGEPGQPALTWDDIKEMKDSGVIKFGSHTITHRDLAKLSPEEIRQELQEPLEKFESPLLAYPFGKKENYNNDVIKIAKELGYKRGFTIEEGTNPLNVEPFEYRRLVIFDEPMFMFKVRVSGIIDDFLNIFKR